MESINFHVKKDLPWIKSKINPELVSTIFLLSLENIETCYTYLFVYCSKFL